MTPDFDIVIVGGGMVGACMAALLANEPTLSDARIALLEPHAPASPPDDELDIRVSAISRASERILTRAQAWTQVPSRYCCAYQAMTVWDAASQPDSASALHFSAAETGEPNLGYIVENRRLLWALLEAAPLRQRVTMLGAQLQNLEFADDCVRVTLSDQRTLRARLVIGADGAQSRSRELAGIDVGGWKYEQSAIVTHVRTEKPHRFTAWQRFTPAGPLAFLPLADGRSSIVWTNPSDQAKRLLELDEVAFARELTHASDRALGEATVAAPRAQFPLQLKAARSYTRPRFALIGDAAHAVHPLAGQGVNLGLMDAACLAQTFAEARAQGASVEALSEARVLRRYERWRKSENLLAMGLIDGLNRLFSNDNPALRTVRSFGFAAIERTPLAKRWLIQRALGVAGEAPRMVKEV